MIKDVVIELVRGRIVFSCPHCLARDVFSPETVGGVSSAITALKCPRCSYMVSLNKSRIEAAIGSIVAADPLVKNPLEHEKPAEPPRRRSLRRPRPQSRRRPGRPPRRCVLPGPLPRRLPRPKSSPPTT